MEREEAIEIARNLYNKSLFLKKDKEAMATLIPELKESEDEEIRKKLIQYFQKFNLDTFAGIDPKKILVWLESQGEQKPADKIQIGKRYNCIASPKYSTFVKGFIYIPEDKFLCSLMNLCSDCFEQIEDVEQKPTDKVEPKFEIKEGKWYVCIRDLLDNYANKAFCKGDIYLSTQNGSLIPSNSNVPFEVVCPDTYFKDWTIEDAKDGDVLACESGWTCIFKKFNHNSFGGLLFDSYCFIDKTGWFCDGAKGHTLDDRINGKIYPATKEQRDLLFQKMHEARYEWNAEKKELKKIEEKSYPETLDKAIELYYYTYGNGKGGFDNLSLEKFKDIVKTFVNDYGIQNYAWNEEDEQRVENLLAIIAGHGYPGEVAWLKSLKERVQPKQEWSEEDEKYLKLAIENFQTLGNSFLTSWLKALKERVHLQNGYNPYKEVVESIAEMCKHYDTASHSGLRDFYDNVRVKCKDAKEYDSLYPQNTWKPTLEQVDALQIAIENAEHEKEYSNQNALVSLMENLKKLYL